MKLLPRLLPMFCCLGIGLSAAAQRNVTPVETDDKKPPTPTLHYYDKHGDPLPEPVLFLATLDTVTTTSNAARPIYPRLQSIDFGLNFFDGILVLAGQHYGGADIWASLSMWNWLFPTVEFGLGAARNSPKDKNFTYKGKLSPYLRIGADYNFLYKSNPRYRAVVGLRAGYSHFTYDVTDITIDSPYWDESQSLALTGQKSHAFWGEILAGLRVDIFKNLSLGWTIRYHTLFGHPSGSAGTPWYIPGYGSRTSPITATFSVIYTLPLHRDTGSTPNPAP